MGILSLLLIVNGLVPPVESTTYDAVGAFGFYENVVYGDDWFCAATLIGPSEVLLAGHCVVDSNATYAVRFRRRVDGGVGVVGVDPPNFHDVAVNGFYIPPEGDIAIAYLAEPILHIAFKRVSYEVPPLGPAVVAGWGREGPGPGEGPKIRLKFCDTEVSYYASTYVSFPTAWVWGCGINNHDSGGPVLVDGAIVGVATAYGVGTPLAPYVEDFHFPHLRNGK